MELKYLTWKKSIGWFGKQTWLVIFYLSAQDWRWWWSRFGYWPVASQEWWSSLAAQRSPVALYSLAGLVELSVLVQLEGVPQVRGRDLSLCKGTGLWSHVGDDEPVVVRELCVCDAYVGLWMCGEKVIWGLGVCGKSLVEIEEWGDTLPVEGSLVAGSGSDTFLYTCSHFCELRGHQKGKVMRTLVGW